LRVRKKLAPILKRKARFSPMVFTQPQGAADLWPIRVIQETLFHTGGIMPIIPRNLVGKIEFFEQHLPVWAVDPAAIGLDAGQIVDLTARTTQARSDYESAIAIRNSAKAATETQNSAVDFMFDLGADLVKTIRAFAETTDDDAVYAAAQIPAPAPPKPTGPPEMPTNLTADVNNFGSIVLEWKGSRAVGTQFILQRQMIPVGAPAGPWTFVGSSVTNDYTDTTVPTGFAGVSYRVYAQRAGGTSDVSTPTTISFGTGAGNSSSETASGDDLTLAA
jgi:hypothetical protein